MLLVGVALGAEVVVFGDSWAEGAPDELEDVLHAHGYRDLSVDPRGVGGTTADYWASTPNALPDAVSANPDARWVWLSIGGNDLFAHFLDGNGANVAVDYDADLRAMLDALFAAHPDIKVVSFGYDFVNFEQSQECILTAWTYFGTSITTAGVNQYFLDDIGGTLTGIAADYPNFTYIDSVWGTLQTAGGIPGAPVVYLPSPAAYMSDCIHPTSEGYTLIHDAWVDDYWGGAEPTVAIEGAEDVCVDGSLALTAVSSGADRIVWTVDGVTAGTGDSLVVPTDTPGSHVVNVRAHARAWDASDEAEVTIWAAPEAAVHGPTEVEVGVAATFQVDLQEGQTASWSAPGGTIVDEADGVFVVRWEGPGDYLMSVDVASLGGCTAQASADITVSGSADSGGDDTAIDGTGDQDTDDPGCGCATGGAAPSVGLLSLALLVRRRKNG